MHSRAVIWKISRYSTSDNNIKNIYYNDRAEVFLQAIQVFD